MNPQQLLAHYDRIADAPDAVSKLREFVLALAVQGKLVPQLRGDQSLDQALTAARKDAPQRAAGIGRMRWEPSSAIGDAETRDLPNGWVVARVNDTGFYINGLAFKPSDWAEKGSPIIRIQNLTDPTKSFNFAKGEFPDEVNVRDGDILVSWSATLDAFIWKRGEGVLNQHIFRVLPDERLTRKGFLHLVLRHAIRELGDGEHARGLVMTHIKRAPFLAHVVGLPPLQEQDRIIAKVDELMALCDQLEAARVEREATRDRLAAASLARLNAPVPETFAADALFALAALPSLTARVGQVKQLRQTILRLACCGQLLAEKGGERRRVGDFRRLQNGYAFKSSWFAKSGIRLLRNVNVGHGSINWQDSVSLPDERAQEFERFLLREGDIVLTLDRPFIVTGTKVARVARADEPSLLLQRVARFEAVASGLDDSYLFLWINSPDFNEQIDPGRSNGVPHISSKQVESAEIYVPPLPEQRSIVAKVDELMALCDQLEASLATADDTRRRLLDALLHEALASTAKPSKEHARAAVSGYLVSRLASKRNFGRTAHMKHLYFAESLLGLDLGGRYMREAAGPLDTGIYELEKRAEAAGWYTHSAETLPSGNEKVSYQPGKALKAIAEEGITVLGRSRAEMDRLIDLMGDLKTEPVEIIATLFAAWNDSLLDGQTPDDNWIIKEVRENWHVSKQRFTPAELKKWLGWMRQNDVVPLGHAPRTMQQTTMEF